MPERKSRGSFACDQCNYRKIKCFPDESRSSCRGCTKTGLECTRSRTVLRKGPKWKTSNPVIQPIIPLSSTSGADIQPTIAPEWNPPDNVLDGILGDIPVSDDELFHALDYTSFLWGTAFSLDSARTDASDPDTRVPDDVLAKGSECIVESAAGGIVSDQLLLGVMRHTVPDSHIAKLAGRFCRRWGAYIVVLNYSALMKAVTRNDHHRSMQFRALLFTTISLGLERDFLATGERDMYAGDLLDEAKRAIALNEQEEPCVAGVVTSLFMFILLEWRNDPGHSWKYLQLAITMAQDLKIHVWAGKDLLPEDQRVFLSTRYRIYLVMCLIERSHTLLGFSAENCLQSIRLDGQYWSATAPYRESLPAGTLYGLHTRHVVLMNFADRHFIECYHRKCGPHCTRLSDNRVEYIHDTLEHLSSIPVSVPTSLEGFQGQALHDVTWSNAAQTAIWLQCILYDTCDHHRLLITDASSHRGPDFVLELLERLVTLPALVESYKVDVTRDSAPKLLQICKIVIRYLSHLDPSERLRGTALLFKATAILVGSSTNLDVGGDLIKQVASIC